MENPTVMQMMMARMPPHMRKPEVMKALMANPDVRARLSAVAQEKVGRARCCSTFSHATHSGADPDSQALLDREATSTRQCGLQQKQQPPPQVLAGE